MEAMGNQASFSWSTGPTVVAARGHQISFRPSGRPHDVTRFGDVSPRFVISLIGGVVVVRVWHDDADATPPPIPTNTVGTLIFSPASGQTATCKAIMVGYSHDTQSNNGAPAQTIDYQFLITATGTAGTPAIELA